MRAVLLGPLLKRLGEIGVTRLGGSAALLMLGTSFLTTRQRAPVAEKEARVDVPAA